MTDAADDPIAAELAKIRGGASAPAPSSDPIADELAKIRLNKTHQDFASGALQRRNANAADMDQAQLSDHPLLSSIAEAAETPMAGLPGGALALSALRKTQGDTRPFAEIQNDVNRETSDAGLASTLGRGVGGVASMGLVPGASGLKAGAILGGADQGLNNTPGSTLGSRALRAAGGAVLGGVAGGLTDAAITGVRALRAPNASESVMAAENARRAVNESPIGPSYKTAGDQATRHFANVAGPASTPQPLVDALAHPGIAPYVNAIKNSELGATMNDAEVGEEAYRMMSELQGKKLTIGANGESTPATDFQVRNLGALKEKLRTGLASVEPDFPDAVATHAEMSQPITAMREGYNAAGQTLGGPVKAKALGIPAKDPLAYQAKTLPGHSPLQAEAATGGALSRTKAGLELTPNLLRGFGLPKSGATLGKVQPLIAALDRQSGNTLPSALQRALLTLGQTTTNETNPE